jgi:hypothetical protein
MRAGHHIVAFSIAALATLAAGHAVATPGYPGVLQETLGMPCPPSCTLCHTDINGGINNVERPFGRAVKGLPNNLGPKQDEFLPGVLRTLENDFDDLRELAGLPPLMQEQCENYECEPARIADDEQGRWAVDDCLWLNDDNDCDGVKDIAELREGRDPNTPGKGNLCAFYGCGASRVEPRGTLDPTAFLAALGLAGMLGALRRRRLKKRSVA